MASGLSHIQKGYAVKERTELKLEFPCFCKTGAGTTFCQSLKLLRLLTFFETDKLTNCLTVCVYSVFSRHFL